MSTPTGRGALARGAGLVALGMTAMNVAAYAFTLLAARRLGPSEYSVVAALMGVVVVVNVLALGVQATTARRVAVAGPDADPGPLVAAGHRAALLLGVLCLALSPVATLAFRLESWLTAATVAVTAAALTVTGVRLGLAQGRHEWRRFAVVSLSLGLGRALVGGAVLWLWPSALGAMVGVALGALVPVAVGLVLVDAPGATAGGDRAGVLREVLHDSHTLLAFFTLTQVDVFAARAILPTEDSGLYAAGIIVTKAVLFLPTFVTVLAYPTLARRAGGRHLHHLGLLVVLGIGLAAVLGVLALPGGALAFVGGPAYAAVRGDLWLFAVLGTVTAMVQLLVQTALARGHRSAVAWVWGALAAVAAGLVAVDDRHTLLLVVLAVDVTLLAVLLAVTWTDEPVVAPEADDALADALAAAEGAEPPEPGTEGRSTG
ncbi:hypothetical protein JQN72_06000 [Phycicoccus sp. CSK15P-2]|uniref:lipopolysaccharide biosynthesis protein n=1 Tax=Phycicoccus sp. CSK15P-2 TaxID=2807627 RepID=UPI00194DC1A2|nr:hypothetical protein [Phycicoccus sp. CSK15P-2]MBM6403793.1 hypothetical protein [Phycicoccus sp. CSK15P-2]